MARTPSKSTDLGRRLGAHLRRVREEQGRTRQAVADAAGLSTYTVAKIERGETVDPGLFSIAALARVLEVSLDELVHLAGAREQQPVLSVGYEGLTQAELLTALVEAQVSTVVDVRLTPISRKPGLSKTKLAAAVASMGMRYVHLPGLGNPKENRRGFGSDDPRPAQARFRELMQSEQAQSDLRRLVEIAADGPAALLCFEREEARCHRAIVLDELAAVNNA